MDKIKRVGIFIPCYNEVEIIGDVINAVRDYVNSDQFPYMGIIIVVDDGSTDGSYKRVKKVGADVVYRHVVNRGLGAATRAGMEIAHYLGCDAFVKFDADMQHDIHDIRHAVEPLLNDEVDILYASRFAGKIHYRMPLIRRLGNRFFTWLLRSLTGWNISDGQTGMMCFGRRYLTLFEMPEPYNPPQQALFDAWKKGMRYGEVPAQFYHRKTGRSFISSKYIYKALTSLLKIGFYHYCFAIYFALGIGLLSVGLVTVVSGLYGYFTSAMPLYVPHGMVLLLSVVLGTFSVLFGLQSYAMLNRMSFIRNGANYRYIILDDVVILSHDRVAPRSTTTEIRAAGAL